MEFILFYIRNFVTTNKFASILLNYPDISLYYEWQNSIFFKLIDIQTTVTLDNDVIDNAGGYCRYVLGLPSTTQLQKNLAQNHCHMKVN